MRYLLVLFLLPINVFALVPEIPGNGIDDGASSGTAGSCPTNYIDAVYSTGCDLKMPDTFGDADNDGYATGFDCDDNDRTMFDGQYSTDGCSSGEAKLCSGGSYGSCAAISGVCEATGTGVCKWVDCTSGSDANPGTFASPYGTLGKVSGNSSGAPAASWTPTAGSVVYIKGSCTTQYSGKHLEVVSSGTSDHYITYRNWPGETPVISASSGYAIYAEGGDKYIKLYGLELSITNTGTSKVIGVLGDKTNASTQAAYWTLQNLIIRDSSGNGDENFGGIYAQHQHNFTIKNIYIKNLTTSTGNTYNAAGIVLLNDDDAGTPEGHSNEVSHIVQTNVSYLSSNVGALFLKHGVDVDDADKSTYSWSYSINPKYVIEQEGGDLHASNLFAYTDGGPAQLFYINQGSSSAVHDNNRIEYSTFINFTHANWRLPQYSGDDLIFSHNVYVSNASSYGEDNGIITIDTYGSTGNKTTFEAGSYLTAEDNTYYNSTTTIQWDYFKGGGAGDVYGFADWKTQAGVDADSDVEDPNHDAYFRPQAVNSVGRGWMFTTAPAPVVETSIVGRGVALRTRGRRAQR